ncbi:MAG: hypothetical protein IPG72_05480 [Ardenticatenales bacterium]|nr:hypothetical protein [Ardenticatenales bacterium]
MPVVFSSRTRIASPPTSPTVPTPANARPSKRHAGRSVVEDHLRRLDVAAQVETAQHMAGAVDAERPIDLSLAGVELDDVVGRGLPVRHADGEVDRDLRARDVEPVGLDQRDSPDARRRNVVRIVLAEAVRTGHARAAESGRDPARSARLGHGLDRVAQRAVAPGLAGRRRTVRGAVDVDRRRVGRRARGAARGLDRPGGDDAQHGGKGRAERLAGTVRGCPHERCSLR